MSGQNQLLQFLAGLAGGGLQGYQQQSQINFDRKREQRLDTENAADREQRRQLLELQIAQARQAPDLELRQQDAAAIRQVVPYYPTAAPRLLGAEADVRAGRKKLGDFTTGDMNFPSGIGPAALIPHHVSAKSGIEALTFGQPSAMDLEAKTEAEKRRYAEQQDAAKADRGFNQALLLKELEFGHADALAQVKAGSEWGKMYQGRLDWLGQHTDLGDPERSARAYQETVQALGHPPHGAPAAPAASSSGVTLDLRPVTDRIGKVGGSGLLGPAYEPPPAPAVTQPSYSEPLKPYKTSGQLAVDKATAEGQERARKAGLDTERLSLDRNRDHRETDRLNFDKGARTRGLDLQERSVENSAISSGLNIGARRQELDLGNRRENRLSQPKPQEAGHLSDVEKAQLEQLNHEISTMQGQLNAARLSGAPKNKNEKLQREASGRGLRDKIAERDALLAGRQTSAVPGLAGPPAPSARERFIARLQQRGVPADAIKREADKAFPLR